MLTYVGDCGPFLLCSTCTIVKVLKPSVLLCASHQATAGRSFSQPSVLTGLLDMECMLNFALSCIAIKVHPSRARSAGRVVLCKRVQLRLIPHRT